MSNYREIICWEFRGCNAETLEVLKDFAQKYGVDGLTVFFNAQEFPHIRVYDVRKADLYDLFKLVIGTETECSVSRARINYEAHKIMIDMFTQPTRLIGAHKYENGRLVKMTNPQEQALPNGGYSFVSKSNTDRVMEVAW